MRTATITSMQTGVFVVHPILSGTGHSNVNFRMSGAKQNTIANEGFEFYEVGSKCNSKIWSSSMSKLPCYYTVAGATALP